MTNEYIGLQSAVQRFDLLDLFRNLTFDDNALYRPPRNVSLVTDRYSIASSRERSDSARSKTFSLEVMLRKRSYDFP